MSFDLGKFFEMIFAPQRGEKVTIMYDLPHGDIADDDKWQDRRKMAEEWRKTLADMSEKWGMEVNPCVTYEATGGNNAELPENGKMADSNVVLSDVIVNSSIILAMPQFSATAPLFGYVYKSDKLRIGSMPGVARFMQDTGLSADYSAIAARCKKLAPVFEKAVGAEVEFATGHKCYFDLSNNMEVHLDDGILHKERCGTSGALSNLPAGETYTVPNEGPDSKTEGELPEKCFGQVIAYQVKNNKIYDIKGEGPEVEKLRGEFKSDPAWQNIAEFAIGCNEKAKVTGIILEDEKAGFHWAYGRSDHFGGSVGPKNFSSPSHVVHTDVIYAKDSPIQCKKLDMIFADGTRQTMIVDGDWKF